MIVKQLRVSRCERSEIKDFIEKWHYSKNINGLRIDYCFKLTNKGELVGAMIYGGVAMAGVWKKYVDKEEELTELRRLCCIDETPKNTESYFIGKTIRWIRDNTRIKLILSYADLTYNHQGIIYQASNFKLVGQTAKGRVIVFNGKRYHDKTIRTKYNGKLKPFAQRVKDALESGDAEYVNTKSKNIYVYGIRRKRSSKVMKQLTLGCVLGKQGAPK